MISVLSQVQSELEGAQLWLSGCWSLCAIPDGLGWEGTLRGRVDVPQSYHSAWNALKEVRTVILYHGGVAHRNGDSSAGVVKCVGVSERFCRVAGTCSSTSPVLKGPEKPSGRLVPAPSDLLTSLFLVCSYLFHYICQDRIIYLCITDDVSALLTATPQAPLLHGLAFFM